MSEIVAANEENQKTKTSMRSWWWLNILLIGSVFLVLGLGLGFYFTKTKQLMTTIEILQEKVDLAQKSHEITDMNIATIQKRMAEQQAQLTQEALRLKQINLMTQQRHWLLTEIYYLIEMANSSLLYSKNINVSLALLEQARQLVETSQNADLILLDQAIKSDQAVLEKTTFPSVANIFQNISSLNQEIAVMPLLGSTFSKEEESSVASQSETAPMTWREKWGATLHQLRSFIIVQKTSNALIPLIAEEEGDYVRQYIYLQLGQAQWALVHYDVAIYQASLKQALKWVQLYFIAQSSVTQKVTDHLEKLAAIDVQFPQVSLDHTMVVLKNTMEAPA